MKYLHQLDYIKCFAAFCVIILHSIPLEILIKTYSVFHIWQAVPLFIILMGFNLAQSKSNPVYNIDYFNKRYKRIIKPFIPIYILSLIFGILFYKDELYIGWLNLIGLMPKSGAGNYYITLLIQFVIIAPVVYWLFTKNDKLTVIILFMLDLVFQIITMEFGVLKNNPYLYSSSIFRYLSALSIGMWLAKDFRIGSKRNYWIVFGSLISIGYLLLGNSSLAFFFDDGWRTQNLLSFFYPALLIMLFLNYIPNKSDTKLLRLFSQIGKASYHIFLIQMIYFALIPANSFAEELSNTYNYYIVGGCLVILNVFICVTIGLLFYKFNFLQTMEVRKLRGY